MAFGNDEQRKASFKHIYGKNQLDPDYGLHQELLESGHQIYSTELLSAGDDIAFAASSPVTFTSASTWTITTNGSMANVWSSGSFNKTSNAGGTDSNYEKVLMPLIQFDTGHESHATFIHTSQSVTGQQTPGNLIQYKDGRLKNWISPVKFGSGYKIKVYGSNTNQDGPNTGDQLNESGNTFNGKNYGGYAFDYTQGILYFANQSNGSQPDLSTYTKPLWIEAYRYIGATGSAAGLTEIDSGTNTNLNFNNANNTITIGANSTILDITTTQLTSMLFETSSNLRTFVGIKNRSYSGAGIPLADSFVFRGASLDGGKVPIFGSEYAYGQGGSLFLKAGSVNAPIGPGGQVYIMPGSNVSHNANTPDISLVPSGHARDSNGSVNILNDNISFGGRLNIGETIHPTAFNRGRVNIYDNPLHMNSIDTYTLGVLTGHSRLINTHISNSAANWDDPQTGHLRLNYENPTYQRGERHRNSRILIGHSDTILSKGSIDYDYINGSMGLYVDDLSGGSTGIFISNGGSVRIGNNTTKNSATLTVNGTGSSTNNSLIKGLISANNTSWVTGSGTHFTSELSVGDDVVIYQEPRAAYGSLNLMSNDGTGATRLKFGYTQLTLDPNPNNFAVGDNLRIGQTIFTFTDDSSAVSYSPGAAIVYLGNAADDAIRNLIEMFNSVYEHVNYLKVELRYYTDHSNNQASKDSIPVADRYAFLDVFVLDPSAGYTQQQLEPVKDINGSVYSDGTYSTAFSSTISGWQKHSLPLGRSSDEISVTASILSIIDDENLNLDVTLSNIDSGRILLKSNYFDINSDSGTNILSVDSDNTMTISGAISASAFYSNGVLLENTPGGGDNLGNHTATQDLNLNSHNIINAANMTASGHISASLYYGDGSNLKNVGVDINLSTDIAMGNLTASNISASGYISASNFVGNMVGYSQDTHNHDSTYYTETEIDSKLSNTANWNAAEPNVQSNWTETDTAVDSYIQNVPTTFTPASHNHAEYYESGDNVNLGSITATANISTSAYVTADRFYTGNHVVADSTSPTELKIGYDQGISLLSFGKDPITSSFVGDISASGNILFNEIDGGTF